MRRILPLIPLALALALGACSDPPTAPDTAGALATLRVNANVSSTPIETIVITVSGSDITGSLTFNLRTSGGVASGTLHVPPGPARTFMAQGFSGTGEITHEGSALADVLKGDNPPLAIKMLPRTGQVPITVTVGSISVEVTPASGTLVPGQTLQLGAAITDESSQPVSGAVPEWGSSNPAVATVDADGLVTAHAPGQAEISALYGGVAGSSQITVRGADIVFMSDRDGNPEIYVMNADGSNQTRLTNDPAQDYEPAWSPDRRRIAFVSDDGLYVMKADGSTRTRLSATVAYKPAWSPDGTKIAFQTFRDGSHDICVMNPDGSNPMCLTNDGANDLEPAWSPDGTKIAFNSDRDGNAEIYVMNADGSNPTRLTNDAADDHEPAWSADGTKIAFTSTRGGNWQIYTMNADGSNATALTDGTNKFRPVWSPDGTKLAFAAYGVSTPNIYVMNADGSSQTNLTNTQGPAQDFYPAWR